MKNVSEKAKAQLLEARKPFDSALEAIEQISNNRDGVIDLLVTIFKSMHPNFEQYFDIVEMLKNGTFPKIWIVNDDLRVDGMLNTPNGLLEFLKEN